MRFILINLISISLCWAADNAVEIDTKGSNSSIYIDQIGSGNTARVWCGLSNGTYATHTCSSATIDIDQNGTGNLAKAYSQYTNHTGNEYTINQDGNDNVGYIDADEDNNEMTITQDGDDMYGEIYMSGDDNVYTITQSGTGEHYAKFYAFGDDSTWTATQSGTGDHNAYINPVTTVITTTQLSRRADQAIKTGTLNSGTILLTTQRST